MMTLNKSNLHLVSYENMRFGEMVESGFDWLNPSWVSQTTNLDPKAQAFYEPIINKYILEHCFIYYPSMDDIAIWQRLLMNEIAKAVNNQAPVLSLLSYPAIMPDGTVGQTGIMNIEEGGTEGDRSVNFGTEYPQAMLNGNIGDYGSDGNAKSNKTVKYIPSLQALKEFNDPNNPYKDAINRIADSVEQSGVFSYYGY